MYVKIIFKHIENLKLFIKASYCTCSCIENFIVHNRNVILKYMWAHPFHCQYLLLQESMFFLRGKAIFKLLIYSSKWDI